MRYDIKVNDKKFNVEIISAKPPLFEVSVNGKRATLIIEETQEVEAISGNEVRAEMAGTIVRIVVEEGEKVEKGQPLLVLEAMKMESEIAAPSSGVVKKILVKEGEKVNAGTPLILLDSGEAGESGDGEAITVAMAGIVTKVLKNPGEEVKEGEAILILEAMKMENPITTPFDGVVESVNVTEGSKVSPGDVVARVRRK
ncbi:biotin/lipoyl-containing protein [Archaeoglobus veneficus]|uniref:Biotin/lipoyl attachment domain-containing protein n=1 Tax=Archaeoglobus veneficus (strain DSM 11195 / SNP6) TaxID=693661 RepID=F2KQ72_ARCVS|nr:biotin/lipoyl-containing protein [Archaeoglobus veneficus]AEA47675.1 biotin/lipoyl attachment domain-containing protein [Archaeoglobus veneficus SNP6]